MNGLRVGPLSWYLEFTNTLRGKSGFGETADPTVHHRLESDGSLTLVCRRFDHILPRSPSGQRTVLEAVEDL